MSVIDKGCVYFFRHIGTTPVKIGYSTQSTCQSRFESFSTYSPYGGEILGFISADNPARVESQIHALLITKRTNGEFFEITDSEVEAIMVRFSSADEIRLRNIFWIEFQKETVCKRVNSKIHEQVYHEGQVVNINRNAFFKEFMSGKKINKVNAARKYKVSRTQIYNWIEEFKNKS
jgi:hypothetical protein